MIQIIWKYEKNISTISPISILQKKLTNPSIKTWRMTLCVMCELNTTQQRYVTQNF